MKQLTIDLFVGVLYYILLPIVVVLTIAFGTVEIVKRKQGV